VARPDSGGQVSAKGRSLRMMVPLVAMVVVASACGRSGGSKAPNASPPPGAKPAAALGDFGSLKAVCGPGNAKGATATGVTDTSINVATMADPGNTAVPGLDQELFDTADAFVGWCNAAGGIQGRKLVLHKRDSALFQVPARMIESCQADFALVGNGEALDATGVQQRVSCKLPEIAAFDVSLPAGTAALSVQPLPAADDEAGLGGPYRRLAQLDPAAIKYYGVLSSTVQSIKDSGNRTRAAAESLGFSTVDYEELPIQVNNWRPYVENLKSRGVQVLTMLNNPDQLAALYKSMADVGYFPKYTFVDANMYNTKLIAEGGSALQGNIYVNSGIVPFELADQYPATKQYINLLQQYAKRAKPKALGVNGFSAWLLFAQSAKACGSNLTRQCLIDQAAATKDWTGGGLHGAQQPGNATQSIGSCFMLLKATPSGFVVDKTVTQPNRDLFNCDPANAFKLKGFPPS
jgi:Periplasmic binding protein